MNHWLRKNLDIANKYLNLYKVEELPSVDIIVMTYRVKCIDRLINNINCQVVKPNKVIVVTDRYTPNDVDRLKGITNCNELFIIDNIPTEVILGERNNIAFRRTTSEYIAVMDDDDRYYPYYLKSQLSYVKECPTPAGLSKINPIGFNEDNGTCGFVLARYRKDLKRAGAGGSLVLHRAILERYGFDQIQCGYDSTILFQTAADPEFTLLGSDPFNFIVTRGRPEGHTWELKLGGIYRNDVYLKDVELRGKE